MRLLRWVLVLPGALLFGMVGSLVGGIAATLFGQAARDTASAFLGTFVFVCVAGAIAPSHRGKTTLAAASLVAILALVSFGLSVFTTIEEFAALSAKQKVLTPVAQLLGALYALFILPPLVTPGTTLERLWREIVALGTLVAGFGALVTLAGVVVGVLGRGWLGFAVGLNLGVLFLGALTWLFPFVLVTLRVKKAEAMMEEHLRELAAREKPEG